MPNLGIVNGLARLGTSALVKGLRALDRPGIAQIGRCCLDHASGGDRRLELVNSRHAGPKEPSASGLSFMPIKKGNK